MTRWLPTKDTGVSCRRGGQVHPKTPRLSSIPWCASTRRDAPPCRSDRRDLGGAGGRSVRRKRIAGASHADPPRRPHLPGEPLVQRGPRAVLPEVPPLSVLGARTVAERATDPPSR